MPQVKSQDILGMSDEDFLNLDPQAVSAGMAGNGEGETTTEDPEANADPDPENGVDTPGDGATDTVDGGEGSDTVEGAEDSEPEASGHDTLPGSGTEGGKGKPKPDGTKDKEKPKEPASPKDKEPEADPSLGSRSEQPKPVKSEDAQEFYQRVVGTPLRANGKNIEIRNADEAIALMQMGANYTQKMQALAPHRKAMTMLAKHDLLDESKLSFLIDIANKNPDAIKRLVKDANIDPMDIGDDAGSTYQPGNHRVSDNEVRFQTAMDELKSTDAGQRTLREIHTTWDDASKEILWEHPEILGSISQHRDSGVYAKITAEIDRQRTLGKIPAEMPFLHAYKQVGDQLVAEEAERSKASTATQQPEKTTPKPDPKAPVAQGRAVAAKPTVRNGDKAAAAGGTGAVKKVPPKHVNYLAMPDDEFMKQMANRL